MRFQRCCIHQKCHPFLSPPFALFPHFFLCKIIIVMTQNNDRKKKKTTRTQSEGRVKRPLGKLAMQDQTIRALERCIEVRKLY